MVNDARSKNGLNPVRQVFVDMVLADVVSKEHLVNQFSNKTSSTYIREFLANTKP